MDQKTLEGLWEASLASLEMDEAANYVGRGRSFAALSREDLDDAWANAFKTWIASRSGGPKLDAVKDLSAELHLRGLARPLERVKPELLQAIEEIAHDGIDVPGAAAEAGTQFAEFLASLRGQKS